MSPVQTYITDILHTMQYLPIENIDQVISILHEARLNHRKIFIMGNGGSAATASHFVCDLLKNTRVAGLPGIRAIGLNDNTATLTAAANDEGYENVFSLQLANLIDPEDIVIGISTSGCSPNVLDAIRMANERGAVTIGFTGKDGGDLAGLVQWNVLIPNMRADQTEDIHLILSHTITASLKELGQPFFVTAESHSEVVSPTRPDKIQKETELTTKSGLMKGAIRRKGSAEENQSMERLLEMFEILGRNPTALYESRDFLGSLLMIIIDAMAATSGSFTILDHGCQIINSTLVYNGEFQSVDEEQLQEFHRYGLAGWVVENMKSALITSTHSDSRWLHSNPPVEGNGRSVICVPLTIAEEVMGIITVSRPENEPFNIKDMLMLTGIIVALTSQLKQKTSL